MESYLATIWAYEPVSTALNSSSAVVIEAKRIKEGDHCVGSGTDLHSRGHSVAIVIEKQRGFAIKHIAYKGRSLRFVGLFEIIIGICQIHPSFNLTTDRFITMVSVSVNISGIYPQNYVI